MKSKTELVEALKNIKNEIGSVTDFDLNKTKSYIFDLSECNEELDKLNLDYTFLFSKYIFNKLKENSARYGIGKYNEDRIIYKRSNLFDRNDNNGARTIHLGIDVWVDPGTKIFAPLDARVHSYHNNVGFGDYGPTIILEHQVKDINFYTLYGHLSLDSLDGIKENKVIKKGEEIARIGNEKVNGSWPAHLHFQIIRDMEDKKGDFYGVTSHLEREKYLDLCPDPNLILKIDKLKATK